MKRLTILDSSLFEKIRTNIFSAVEVVNHQLVSHLIVDDVNFYETFVSVVVGTTSPSKCVTSPEVNALCRYITDIFIKLGIVTLSPCRFIAIDFEESVFTLAVDL